MEVFYKCVYVRAHKCSVHSYHVLSRSLCERVTLSKVLWGDIRPAVCVCRSLRVLLMSGPSLHTSCLLIHTQFNQTKQPLLLCVCVCVCVCVREREREREREEGGGEGGGYFLLNFDTDMCVYVAAIMATILQP